MYETVQPLCQVEEEGVEIKQNEAYLTLSNINVKNCPAYITHGQALSQL